MTEYKLCTMGEGAVGKTSIIIQLCSNKFVEEYDPTIEDCYRKQMVVDNKAGVLDILDTTGQEEFMLLRDQWIGDSEGFLIIYSVTSRNSYEQVKIFRDHIYRVKEGSSKSKFPILIVGNKIDLDDLRQVSTKEGKELAKQLSCEFIECSAKTRENIEDAFAQIVRAVRIHRGEVPSSSSSSSSSHLGSSSGSVSQSGGSSSLKDSQNKRKSALCFIL